MIVGISLNRICAILLSILVWIIWFIFFIFKSNKNETKENLIKTAFLRFILFIYIGFIAGLTLLPIAIPPRGITENIYINLDIFHLFKYTFNKFAVINILGNLLLFTPLVILTSLNKYKIFSKLYKVILYGIILSLFIEFIQYIEIYFGLANSARSVDITDVILNTFGALIGFIVIKIYYRVMDNNKIKDISYNKK